MNKSFTIETLTGLGFVAQDQTPDFGYTIPYVFYGLRMVDGQFQYISAVFYADTFCEGIFEIFLKKKNTRMPKGTQKRVDLEKQGYFPTHIAILRSLPEIQSQIKPTSI